MERLFRDIRTLVDIPSVSGEEGDVGRYLEKDLRERGFSVTLQEVESDRFNVYATQEGSAPGVVFCTHIDTVPPFYESREDETHIHGRGTCDAKGIAASMIHATEALRDEGVTEVGLLFVVGEEVDSVGAYAANSLPSSSRFVVVGEPTESRMATGHKGGFKFRVTAKGKAAHSAYPALGDSAIHHLLDGLQAIRAQDFGRSDVLGEATINVGTLAGGLAANVFAPEASADVFVRVVGDVDLVRAAVDRALEGRDDLSYSVISESDAVICETLPGYEVAPVSFGTDIPALTAFGKPLLLGPGSIHDAHTDREKLGKSEAVESVGYYQKLAKQLLSA